MNYARIGVLMGLLLVGSIAHAGLVINEIMYDAPGTDTDHEWIEVYNGGASSVDLTTYKLFEANTNHSLVSVSGGNTLAAGGYAVIAATPDTFEIDWPTFSGILLDSSFSLSNETGETLSLKDASGAVTDTVTYATSAGAAGDGNTLGLVDGNWVSGTPTPGGANERSTATTTDTDTASQMTTTKEPPKPVSHDAIVVDIITTSPATASITQTFKSTVSGFEGEPMTRGKFTWNFGDGTVYEEVQKSDEVTHTYTYPGDYVVTLAYSRNSYLPKPEAMDRTTLSVVAAGATITGILSDGTVELSNTSKTEVDISGWWLASGSLLFHIPENTYLLAGKKTYLTSSATGFPAGLTTVELRYPNETTAMRYPAQQVLGVSTVGQTTHKTISHVSEPAAPNILESVVETPVALASDESRITEETKKPTHSPLVYGSLTALALITGATVLMLRRNKKATPDDSADDFEIVE